MANVSVTVRLPASLTEKLEPLLIARDLKLDEAIRLYLRSLVTSSERAQALGPTSPMPFGKFKGEEIGVIIRAEPTYVSWLIGNSQHFKLEPECLAMLERALEAEAA